MQQNLNYAIGLNSSLSDKTIDNSSDYDYSKFKQLEDFDWDNELYAKFSPIAKKLNLSQESVDLLLDLALEMSRKQKSIYDSEDKTRFENQVMEYNKLFCADCDIPNANSSQLKEYMMIANAAYSDFCSPKLKDIFSSTGLIYHPELVKFFYKIGELSQEDTISHYGKPAIEELTPAQILYGTKN